MSQEKAVISCIFIGHVDSGKSTTSGHLVYKCGGIDKRTIEKYEKEAADMGKASFKYAWVLDKLKHERSRGITIDVGNCQFQTEHNNINLLDAPGHRDFMKNMISGASAADAAVAVIPAASGEAETAIGKGGSTQEHLMLAWTLGVRMCCIAINKMDACGYSEERFNEIKREVLALLKKIGFQEDRVPFIPVSGWNGDNVVEPSDKMSWYKGWKCKIKNNEKNCDEDCKGVTLLDYLDCLKPPVRPIGKPLRVPLSDAYRISGVGSVPVGRVESGVLKPGMNVFISPSNVTTEVKSIEMHHQSLESAKPGDSVGFNVKNVPVSELKRGMVVGDAKNNPPREASSFDGQIIVIRQLSKSESGIKEGYKPTLDVHTAHCCVHFKKIIAKVDKRSGKPMPEDEHGTHKLLKCNDSAIVQLVPERPLCLEPYGEFAPLGRFALRDSKMTVGVGVVKSVEKKEPSVKAAGGAAKGGDKGAAKAGAAKGKGK